MWEPCEMCAATIYWANIGHAVCAASNEQLDELVSENAENLTISCRFRDILGGGKKDVQVVGPIEKVSEEVVRFRSAVLEK